MNVWRMALLVTVTSATTLPVDSAVFVRMDTCWLMETSVKVKHPSLMTGKYLFVVVFMNLRY